MSRKRTIDILLPELWTGNSTKSVSKVYSKGCFDKKWEDALKAAFSARIN